MKHQRNQELAFLGSFETAGIGLLGILHVNLPSSFWLMCIALQIATIQVFGGFDK